MDKTTMIIRVGVLAVAFAVLFEFAPLWLRGAVLGMAIGVLMNMASERTRKLNKYEELLSKVTKGKNGPSTRRKR